MYLSCPLLFTVLTTRQTGRTKEIQRTAVVCLMCLLELVLLETISNAQKQTWCRALSIDHTYKIKATMKFIMFDFTHLTK